jgi:serine/threonine-protein kinase HipA
MEKGVLPYVDLEGAPHLVGLLWTRARKNKESASFEYDPASLENPVSFFTGTCASARPGSFSHRGR